MRVKRRYHPVLMLEDLQLARRNEKEKHKGCYKAVCTKDPVGGKHCLRVKSFLRREKYG